MEAQAYFLKIRNGRYRKVCAQEPHRAILGFTRTLLATGAVIIWWSYLCQTVMSCAWWGTSLVFLWSCHYNLKKKKKNVQDSLETYTQKFSYRPLLRDSTFCHISNITILKLDMLQSVPAISEGKEYWIPAVWQILHAGLKDIRIEKWENLICKKLNGGGGPATHEKYSLSSVSSLSSI